MVVHSGIAQQSTAQHRTEQHSIVLHCTVQNSTAQYDDCIISVFLDTSSGECMQLALLQSARRKAGGGGFPRCFVLPEAMQLCCRTHASRPPESGTRVGYVDVCVSSAGQAQCTWHMCQWHMRQLFVGGAEV